MNLKCYLMVILVAILKKYAPSVDIFNLRGHCFFCFCFLMNQVNKIPLLRDQNIILRTLQCYDILYFNTNSIFWEKRPRGIILFLFWTVWPSETNEISKWLNSYRKKIHCGTFVHLNVSINGILAAILKNVL